MQEIPEQVRAALEELKSRHRHHLQLRRCEGGYYVSEATSKWDPEKGRNRAISIYVGKITDNGEFIEPVRKRSSTMGVENLDQYMKLSKERSNAAEKQQFESEYEPLILKELSTNPRDGIAAISKRIGLTYSTTQYWIKKLEQKYGIKYTIEPGFLSHFSLSKFIAIAKFKDIRPNQENLQKLLKANPNVQLAFMARGSYDLFIFFLAKDPLEAEQLIYEIRKSDVLAKCTAEWFSSYYTQAIGFIPIRDEFFQMLEKRVWHRSKEHPRKEKDQIFMREYATLRELNNDGLITFTEIDRRYGLKEGSALYTYQQLLKNEMIFRTTITMQNPPIKDTVVFIAKQLDVKRFIEHRKEWLANVLSDGEGPLNKYIFEGDIGSPYGLIHIAPTYKDCNIESIEQNLYASVKGIKIETSIITKFLVGTFSYRKFDMKKSILYKINKQEIE
ncbi:MAG: hypothetical protein M1559_02920 [Candidatus Marsarchaeota archaeon]|nr:hypothetical protein [Candidatus Marsarchaeota archaeon]